VTINDLQAPVLTACPASITNSADIGLCTTTVTYTAPTATDACDGSVTVTCTPASGSSFAAGTTTVTCEAYDTSNNTNTCSFIVRVNDTQAPTITAPAMVEVCMPAAQANTAVSLGTPVTADNCSVASVTSNAPALFPPGTNLVTWTVTDASGNTNAATQTVIVRKNVLLVGPSGATKYPGDSVTFTTIASGTGPFTYVWRLNGGSPLSSTSNSLTIPSIVLGDAGTYSVEVNGYCGASGSATNTAVLTVVGGAPTISVHPASRLITPGTPVTLSVTAANATSYHWLKDGSPVSGGNASTLVFGTPQLADAGAYSVVVSNANGSLTSQTAYLTVVTPTDLNPLGANFIDFNNVGQLTNTFGVRNRAGNQIAVWYETNSSGVGNSRALEGVVGSTTDNTLTYLGDSFTFPPVDGATLNMSIMFKGKPRPAAGNPVAQLGFFSSTNTVHFVTNSFMEGNSLANWINLRLAVANNATNMQFEYGVLVTTNRGTAFTYANALTAATPVGPVAGNNASFTNWYRLTATFTRGPLVTNISIAGTLQDMGADGTVPGATVMTLPSSPITNLLVTQGFLGDTFYPAVRALEGNGADNLDNFAVWSTNGAPVASVAPASSSITTYRTTTFRARVDGTPPFTFQWYTNGVAVPGAVAPAFTPSLLTAADTINVTVGVTNGSGGVVTAPATLTVTADGTAPNVASVGSLDGTVIGLAFDESVNAAQAQTAGNYTVTPGGTPSSAVLLADGRTVRLTMASAISGSFSVSVSGVTDLAGNALASTSAGSVVLGLTPADIGMPVTAGASFSSNTGDIDVTAGGQDTGGVADQFHATMQARTGDFDLRVRVQDIIRARNFNNIQVNREEIGGAGFMVRESLNPGSRDIYMRLFPRDSGMPAGGNRIQWLNRTTTFGAAAGLVGDTGAPAYLSWFPNAWMRMRRVNNTFTLYWSTNGVNWTQGAQTTQVYPNTVQAGLATCAHIDDLNSPVTAQYRNYGDYSVPGASIGFVINLMTNAGLNLNWPTTNSGATLTVTVTNTTVFFPNNEFQFVWQRGDGAGGFTNIPNAGAQVTSNPNTNSAVSTLTTAVLGVADSGTQFRVIAKGPGSLAVTSQVSTIWVSFADTARPSVVSAWVPYLASNVIAVNFNVPLDIATVSNAANYLVTNSLGQVFTVTGVTYEQAGLTGANIYRVILTTSQILTNGPLYNVVVSNVSGTNGFTILPGVARAFGSGTVKVELWPQTGTGTHITNDFRNNAKVLSNAADLVFFTNTFSFNASAAGFNDTLSTYGGRLSGYFIPPSNGTYRFFIRNDDSGQLYFNPLGADPAGKVLVAYQPTANANYGATLNTNLSASFALLSNEVYYIEGVWKENSGGDGFALMFREAAVAGTPATSEIADGRFFRPVPLATPVPLLHSTANLTNIYRSALNLAQPGVMGPVRVEIFMASGSGTIATFTNSTKYLNNTPDITLWTNVFGMSTNLADIAAFGNNYGGRLTAYFIAPSNGFYRFYTKSDDGSQLAMNTNGSLASGQVVLASLAGYTPNYASNGIASGVTPPVSLTNGQWYHMEALWAEGTGGDGIAVAWRSFPTEAAAAGSTLIPGAGECIDFNYLRPVPVSPSIQFAYQPPIQAELYTGVSGSPVSDLTGNFKALAAMPDILYRQNYFGFNRDISSSPTPGDNYGARISAYFVAPSNGYYRFYVRNDDQSQLFMSTNNASSTDYASRALIARADNCCVTYTNGTGGSESAPITMIGGQRYYMEALLKEGGGGDGVSVTFRSYFTNTTAVGGSGEALGTRTTGIGNAEFIPYTFFAPIMGPVTANAIAQSPGTPSGGVWNDGQTVTFSINGITGAMPIGFQWKRNGVPIPGANSFSYTTPAISPADIGVITYSVEVWNQQSRTERFINLNIASVLIDSGPPFITSAIGNGIQNEVTVTFNENVDPATGTNIANYSIPGLTLSGAYLRAANVVALLTSAQTPGTRYTVTALGVRDTSRNANPIVPPGSSFTFTAWSLARGYATVDLFTGINNNVYVQALYGEPKFIFNTPDQTQYSPVFGFGSFIPGGANFADNYGARVYALFIAPSNGNYRFFIRSDDMSELFMNTNTVNSADPAGKVPIAAVSSGSCCQGYGNLIMGPAVSLPITLVGGQRYYLEAIMKEGGGGDGVGVAFREVNDPTIPVAPECIPGFYLESPGNPDSVAYLTLTNQPASTSVMVNNTVALTVGAITLPVQLIRYQWQQYTGGAWRDVFAGLNVAGTNTSIALSFPVAGSYLVRAIASVPGIGATSAVATITVTNPVVAGPTVPVLAWTSADTNGTTLLAQFSETVTAASAENIASYTLAGTPATAYAVTAAALRADGRTVVLTVSPALTPGNETNYTLTASGIVCVDDAQVGGGSYAFYAPGGRLRYDLYQPNAGGVIPNPFWSHTPNLTGTITSNFYFNSSLAVATNGTANWMDNYLGRIYGYLIPPSNGLYRFFVRSDDPGQFWINTNAASSHSPTGKVLVASAPSANLGYDFPGAFSGWIPLNAGQRYYVEGLFSEGSGGDYISVAVKEAGDPIAPIFTNNLSTEKVSALWFGLPDGLQLVPTPSLAPTFAESATNAVLGTVIGVPAAVRWYSNNVAITTATNGTYALPVPLPASYNGVNVQVVATNSFSLVSNQFTLTVTADSTAPSILGVSRCNTWTNLIVNFSELLDPTSATNAANYSVADDLGAFFTVARVFLRPDGRSVAVSINPPASFDPARTYFVTNNNIGDRAAVTNRIPANTVASSASLTFTTNFLGLDFYTNISGGALATLSNDVRFLNNLPDFQIALASMDWHYTNLPYAPTDPRGLNYGLKLFGWFNPPSNGVYRFYMRSDDASVLSMNTNGPSPVGKAQILGPLGCCGSYVGSTVVTLTNGTPYYLEALLGQGGGQEYLQATWAAFPDGATALAAGIPMSPNAVGWPSAIWPSAPVMGGPFFGLYGDPTLVSNLTFTLQPAPSTTNVAAGSVVTLSAMATNAGGSHLFHQWQASGDGGTTWTNVGPVGQYLSDYAILGNRSNYTATYFYTTLLRDVATLPGGLTVTSSTATVTVPAPLNIVGVSATNLSGNQRVVVVFDRPVDLGSAQEPLNYTFNDGAVNVVGSPAVQADGRTVVMAVDAVLAGQFTIDIGGVGMNFGAPIDDVIFTVNYSGTVTGTVLSFDFVNDVGSAPGTTDPLLRGSFVTTTNKGLDVTAGGTDIFGTADGEYFVARNVTGDFDIKTRVASLTNLYRALPDANAKAALQARVNTNGNSRMVTVNVAPGVVTGWPVAGTDRAQFIYRDTVAASAAAVTANNPVWSGGFVTPWVRLVRRGSLFLGYFSRDGTNWINISARETAANGGAYPDSVLVGFATCSHNNTTNAFSSAVTAMYRDIYFPDAPTITSQPSGTNVAVGQTIVLSVTGANPADSGTMTYQWRKGGVNIAGANSATLTFASANVSDSGNYTVLVGNDGGAAQSATAVVTVTNVAAAIVPETLATIQNMATNFGSALLLGNDTDPEGRALSIIAVSGVAPVTFYTDFETNVPNGTTIYNNAAITNGVGVTNSQALALTAGAASQSGAWIINDLVPGYSVSAFSATFKMRLGDMSGNAADGISFNVASDLPNGYAGGEEGAGTGLSVCLDQYDNGNNEAPAFDIKWRGAVIAHVPINKQTNQNWVPVTVNMRADGRMDLFLTNVALLTNFQTPYLPITGARFGFFARTGGEFQTHWLDEVGITVFSAQTTAGSGGLVTGAFTNNFGGGIPAGAILFGHAYITNQGGVGNSPYLKLTEGAGSQSGSIILPELTPGRRVAGFAMNLMVRISDNVGEPADGFSINFAGDLPFSNITPQAAEEGGGSGLSLCYDAYRANGSASNSAFRLKFGTNVVASQQTTNWTQAAWIPVQFILNANGTVTVTVNGTNVFSNVATTFTPRTGRFGFYARTGGSFQSHGFDDININVTTADSVSLVGTDVIYAPPAAKCGSDTVYYLISDGQGGTSLDYATVQLIDVTLPVVVSPATNRTIFANGSCLGSLPDLTTLSGLVVTDNCAVVTLTQAPPAGTLVGLGVTTVTIYALDAWTNLVTTSAFVTNVDNTAPSLTVSATNIPAGAGVCYALNSTLGLPDVVENCSVAVLTNDAPTQIPVGTNAVVWTAIDGSGNTTLATQVVVVVDTQLPSITCPTDLVVSPDAGLCYSTASPGSPSTGDNCGVASVSSNAPPTFPVGTTVVTWSVIDVNGNSNGCLQTVIVLTNLPSISVQPVGTNAVAGADWTLTVTAFGCPSVSYQWYFGASPVGGATNSSLALSNMTSCNGGDYTVVIANAAGSVTSSVAVVVITNTPLLIAPGGGSNVANQAECASLFLVGGAAYNWELTNAAGTAGTGWDLVSVSGGIDVQSASTNPFTVNLISLNGGVAGPAANWDYDATNVFTIATATDGVTNFAANKFVLNDSAFSNDLAGGVFSIEEGSLKVRFTPNHAPVAATVTNTRAPNLSLKINLSNLLATATSDADGDGRVLIGFSASTNAATISTNSTYLFYSNSNNVRDEFTYVVRDNRTYRDGDTVRMSTNTIVVEVVVPSGTNQNIVSISHNITNVVMRFAGIPGYAYDVQRATNLTPPVAWSTLHTTNAPPLGLFDFVDDNPPVGQAYYRTSQP
jgi:hypothetical protein